MYPSSCPLPAKNLCGEREYVKVMSDKRPLPVNKDYGDTPQISIGKACGKGGVLAVETCLLWF